jgi:hypothetical protein
MDELKPVAKYVINDLCDQIEKKKIISNQRLDRVEDISLKRLKDVKIILKNAFREQYQDAKKMAQVILKQNEFIENNGEEALMEIEESTQTIEIEKLSKPKLVIKMPKKTTVKKPKNDEQTKNIEQPTENIIEPAGEMVEISKIKPTGQPMKLKIRDTTKSVKK